MAGFMRHSCTVFLIVSLSYERARVGRRIVLRLRPSCGGAAHSLMSLGPKLVAVSDVRTRDIRLSKPSPHLQSHPHSGSNQSNAPATPVKNRDRCVRDGLKSRKLIKAGIRDAVGI